MRSLLQAGAQVRAYDPVAMAEAKKAFPDNGVLYGENLESTLQDADAVVVVTPWKQFAAVPAMLRSRQPAPLFVDGRRAFDPVKDAIANYEGIGL
jgi:UDP-glucose 6-dehydrogenase